MCRWMSPESSPCPSADGDPRTRATDQLGLFHERRRHPTCQPGTCGWRSGVGSSLRRPAARPIGPCERLRSDIQHRARHAHPPAHTGGAYHAHGAAASSAAATRTASAANIRRPTSAPATAAGHHAARRRRGRPSRPLAGLLLQRARRRRVGSHDTPCPRIDCPRLLRCRTDARWSALRRRTLTTQRAPSGCRLAVPTSRPPPLAATGSFGLTCRTATGITGLRCGASCTFILSLQRHGRKKVGSLRSAICLLAADVYTMGGQGGGPRRAVRPPIDT